MSGKDRNWKATLGERFAYRSKRRTTQQGLALDALGGDREAITALAKYGQLLMHDVSNAGGNNADAAFWLASILGEIARGVEPDVAFGYRQPRTARQLEDFGTLSKKWHLANAVERFAELLEGQLYDDAILVIQKFQHVSTIEAGNVIVSITRSTKALSANAAKQVALDIVSHFGVMSGSIRASRDTINAAHAELKNKYDPKISK